MSTAGFADESPEPLPPLPKRKRTVPPAGEGVTRFTVTRLGLINGLRAVMPPFELEHLARLADVVLEGLPSEAPPFGWPLPPVLPLRDLAPDHECSHPCRPPYGLDNPGPCLTCGKSWRRVQAEARLDAALAEFAATEPAPLWDRPSLDRLGAAVFQYPPARDVTAPAAPNAAAPVAVDADTLSVAPEGSQRDRGRVL